MAFSAKIFSLSIFALLIFSSHAQLSPTFYSTSCPKLLSIVRSSMTQAVNKERRLFFHDCFVNGCDGSILFDDTSSFTGKKNAFPNRNSARGFEVIYAIKTNVENGTVSCADILAIAARDRIPSPASSLSALISSFSNKGLNALSGAHTIGQSQCTNIYNDTNINAAFASSKKANCPAALGSGDSNLAPLDAQTPGSFDNGYYKNLVGQRGLLHSDQELFNGGVCQNGARFASDFAAAMIRMGAISPLTGSSGEIRKNCRKMN
ncbi:Peroxidase 52 [Acorus calamus]|uniref:Peroxidase 52 n=1 Tax=Acorus calamus TaxID=4465 RepID=A0AAV9F812_ACOCL|nr:Peroxidase 52 [Acorus calamus]